MLVLTKRQPLFIGVLSFAFLWLVLFSVGCGGEEERGLEVPDSPTSGPSTLSDTNTLAPATGSPDAQSQTHEPDGHPAPTPRDPGAGQTPPRPPAQTATNPYGKDADLSYLVDKTIGDQREVSLPGGIGLRLTYIPKGTFTMGSPASEEGHRSFEAQARVTISQPFMMGVTEVTQEQWKAVTGTSYVQIRDAAAAEGTRNMDLADPLHDKYAMRYVTWDDAVAFCEKLTEIEQQAGALPAGWVYRLPTEAEWEYACRANTTTRFSSGDRAEDLDRVGWYHDNNVGLLAEDVGAKPANPWGLHDMHGGVAEWCLGRYVQNYVDGATDPYQPFVSSNHQAVNRGGNYIGDLLDCRSAARKIHDRDRRARVVGFRIVLAPGFPGSD